MVRFQKNLKKLIKNFFFKFYSQLCEIYLLL